MIDFATTARQIIHRYVTDVDDAMHIPVDIASAAMVRMLDDKAIAALVAAHEADKREAVWDELHGLLPANCSLDYSKIEARIAAEARIATLDTPEEGTNE